MTKKILDYELVRLLGTKKRCTALLGNGNRCKKLAKYRGSYHGESELYYGAYDDVATWVQVEFCEAHALATLHSDEDFKNLPIIITPKLIKL